MSAPLIVLLAICLFARIPAAEAAASDEAIGHILQTADELQLAQHETWLALLHYKREILSRKVISQADDEDFFLDESGKTDAAAELKADLTAFLKGPHRGHAQCRFPARWWWLAQQIDGLQSYEVRCPLQEAFMTRIAQDKLFLVFPTMYLNNPGSTFGHTFLRFDGNSDSVMLSQTLNYAARVDKEDGLLTYVKKGLFGGYTGFFKARPYYETVQEYSNIENRDIWEYQLDFSEQEIIQLARHIWEVKGIDFDYYFFRENCAYRLLALLDVIRPGMQLTGEGSFPLYAIPVDTVRTLEEQELISTYEFRASLATQIEEKFSVEKGAVSLAVLNILSDRVAGDAASIDEQLQPLESEADKSQALSRSFEILQFREQASSPKAQSVLQLMNNLPVTVVSDEKKKNDNTVEQLRVSPEQGHESLLLSAGYGEQNSNRYIDLRFRPAFHDLLDAPQGYVDGAAINIFDFRFKWFVYDAQKEQAENNLRLESLSFINVTSLNPVKRWSMPVSWLFDIRLDRTQLSDTASVRNFIARGGAGFSFKYHRLQPYLLIMAESNLSSNYDKGYSLLLGAQTGFNFALPANQFSLSYERDAAVAGADLDRDILKAQWQLNLQVNHALRLTYKRIDYDFYRDKDWSFDYRYYF